MRWLAAVLVLVLVGLQVRLWIGDGSLAEVQALRDEIAAQQAQLERMRARNLTLEAEVQDLREGLDALEERARSELGMIKEGEIFLQVIEKREEGRSAVPSFSVDGEPPAGPRSGAQLGRGRADGGPARPGDAVDARGSP